MLKKKKKGGGKGLSRHCRDPHSPAANEVDNASFDIFSISGKHANAFLVWLLLFKLQQKKSVALWVR